MITEEAFREEINELAQQGTDIDPQPLHFRVFQPKETLMSGLRVVMHHEVEWLKEYDEVADWLSDNKGKGLFLIGPVGVGKTEICMKVIPIIFLRLFKLTISRMSSTDIVTHEKYSTAISTTMIVIDDVGAEGMYNDYGTMHNVLLIATTNLNDEELREKYGERTMDRIRANMRIIILDEQSLRGRYAKNYSF